MWYYYVNVNYNSIHTYIYPYKNVFTDMSEGVRGSLDPEKLVFST